MIGIISCGAYVPFYRLNREEISRAWMSASIKGERAVAGPDEDSITMAVDAAVDCLGDIDRKSIDGLYFASTTSPYSEKQSACLIATALDLREDILTIDFGNSLRAGTAALLAALDGVTAGSAKKILVVAADCRQGKPMSTFEAIWGDGAVAFLVGNEDVAVEIKGKFVISDEFIGLWRMQNEKFVRGWEDRFVTSRYESKLEEAVSGAMKKYNLTAKDFTKAVLYAPDPRSHMTMVKKLGFDAKNQAQDPLFTTVGNTGTAFALMMLVAALEEASPGDRILLANYGDGADAFVIQVTDGVQGLKGKRAIRAHLKSKMLLPNYEKYLLFRELIPAEPPARPQEVSSASLMSRKSEVNGVIRFLGTKCKHCGTLVFPPSRVCINCLAKDEFEYVRLSDKKGKIFSMSQDRLAAAVDPPTIIAVINFDVGGRVQLSLTDRDPANIAIGMPVEFTFRKFHEGGGFNNYFWKARPPRTG